MPPLLPPARQCWLPRSPRLPGIRSAPQNPPPAQPLPGTGAKPCPTSSGPASCPRGHQFVCREIAAAAVLTAGRNGREDSSCELGGLRLLTRVFLHDGGFFGQHHGNFIARSEERRVGKECRSRWSPYH